MNKESSHRSHELKALGWNQEDLSKYEELWEYSQRWGLINLEREDRQFLKKAEKLIPKIQPKKISLKKSIQEKSYFLWLSFYLEQINSFDKTNLSINFKSVWGILIQSELELLQKYKPVMGLPDTLKAKGLHKIRTFLIEKAIKEFEAINNKDLFDFDVITNFSEPEISKSWKSIIENDPESKNQYPVIDNSIKDFRLVVDEEIDKYMRTNYPSLKENL